MAHKNRSIELGGTVYGMAHDTDAMGEPLGLSGTYTVCGLDNAANEAADHEFQVVLAPEMTPFHIVRRAALEHRRIHYGDRGWHIYFEYMRIDRKGHVIVLSMGS